MIPIRVQESASSPRKLVYNLGIGLENAGEKKKNECLSAIWSTC